jgi:ATP-dependent exoDNAse (exonuclease V) beta subunit
MERGDRRDDLLLAPIEKKGSDKESAMYKYLSKVYGDKELLEQTRLFYVAATRARKKLYLFGHVKASGDDGIKTESKSFLSSIEKSLNADMIVRSNASKTMAAKKEEDGSDLSAVPPLRRLPAKWKRPDCAQSITVDVNTADKEPDKLDVPFYWAGGAIKHLGTVIHKYLCRIAREGLSSWNVTRIEKQKNCIEAMLSQLGLNKEEALQMSTKGVEILCKTLEDDFGRWILEDHLEGVSEMPVTSIVNGEIIHVIIDRTFVDDDDIRWVVDYKISFHGGGLLGDFLESEKKRYKEQLEKYASILKSGGEKRKIKKALYHPALSTLTEL